MKKLLIISFTILVILFVTVSCSNKSNVTSTQSSKTESKESSPGGKYLTENEILQMYSNPDKYKGQKVNITGKIFVTPEYENDFVAIQIWCDIENNASNAIVYYGNTEIKLKDGDYVKIDGTIKGVFEGKNAFGGAVTAPTIEADTLEILSYKDAVSPTIKELTFTDKIIDQSGYEVSFDKVEFAEKETRVYLTINNKSNNKFNAYAHSAKIIQNNEQFENEYNYDADYKKLQSDILPGVKSDGVIVFKAINQESFEFMIEGSSYNYDIDIKPYKFKIDL